MVNFKFHGSILDISLSVSLQVCSSVLEHRSILGSGVSRLHNCLDCVGVADGVQTSLRLLAGKRLGARLIHNVVLLHAVLGLDGISKLLSCLLKLLLGGGGWNGVGLSIAGLVEKRSSNTDSCLVFDLDVDWSWLALSGSRSVHGVVHDSSLVNLSSLDEWPIARSRSVSSVQGVAVSVRGAPISILDDAAANDSKGT